MAKAKDPEFIYLMPDDDTAYLGPELNDYDDGTVVIEYKRVRRVKLRVTAPSMETVK